MLEDGSLDKMDIQRIVKMHVDMYSSPSLVDVPSVIVKIEVDYLSASSAVDEIVNGVGASA